MFIARRGVELANRERCQKVPVNRSVSCTTIDVERIGPAMAEKSSEMDVSEVCETKGATVHGVIVGELSPVIIFICLVANKNMAGAAKRIPEVEGVSHENNRRGALTAGGHFPGGLP